MQKIMLDIHTNQIYHLYTTFGCVYNCSSCIHIPLMTGPLLLPWSILFDIRQGLVSGRIVLGILDRIVHHYKKLINAICTVFESVAILSLVLMFVAVMIQVIGRYFFMHTPGWTEELARQLMVVFSFIGIAIGVKNKIHIALSFFVDNMPRTPRLVIETIGKLVVLVMGIMMSMRMYPFFIVLRYNRMPGTGMPVSWRFIFPTMVGILIALIAAYQIYDHFKYGTDEEQKQKQLEAAASQGA